MRSESMTGRKRYRVYLGKVILQVEVNSRIVEWCGNYANVTPCVKWRDAKIEDITEEDTGLKASEIKIIEEQEIK